MKSKSEVWALKINQKYRNIENTLFIISVKEKSLPLKQLFEKNQSFGELTIITNELEL